MLIYEPVLLIGEKTMLDQKYLKKQSKKHKDLYAPKNYPIWLVPESMNPLEPLSKKEMEMLSVQLLERKYQDCDITANS